MSDAPFRVLAIDGGGVRGVIPATILAAIEERIDPYKQLKECFDLVAGSSTGALLACSVAYEIRSRKVLEIYKNSCGKVFPKSLRMSAAFRPKYSAEGLKEVLHEVLGGRKFGDAACRVLVTSFDVYNRRPILFKSWDKDHTQLKAVDVCLASASAPTYFPAHRMTIRDAEVSLVDGGVVANNPSDLALAEAQGLAGGDHPLGHFRVVSLGTGRYIRRLEPGNWGWLRWASPIIDVMFGAGSEAVDLALKRRLPEECYLRCQVRLEGANDAMDDGSKDNLNKLISITQAHLDSEGREKLVKRVLEMCGVKDRDQMRRETEELKSRIVARGLLLAKFQSLSKQAEERLGQLSLEDLEKLKKMVARDEARSLRELGLED